jgi:hypothetical protein
VLTFGLKRGPALVHLTQRLSEDIDNAAVLDYFAFAYTSPNSSYAMYRLKCVASGRRSPCESSFRCMQAHLYTLLGGEMGYELDFAHKYIVAKLKASPHEPLVVAFDGRYACVYVQYPQRNLCSACII